MADLDGQASSLEFPSGQKNPSSEQQPKNGHEDGEITDNSNAHRRESGPLPNNDHSSKNHQKDSPRK